MRAEVREAGFCPHWLLMLVCTELRGLSHVLFIADGINGYENVFVIFRPAFDTAKNFCIRGNIARPVSEDRNRFLFIGKFQINTKTKIILMFYDAPQGISEVHSDICLIAVILHDLFLLQGSRLILRLLS